jgi:hypothetical protein
MLAAKRWNFFFKIKKTPIFVGKLSLIICCLIHIHLIKLTVSGWDDMTTP